MSRDPCRRRDGLHRPRFYHLPLSMFHFILRSDLITLQYCPVQLQKVGLSSSLPISTQSMQAPSPASQRSAHSTRSCSPVSRPIRLALPPEPTFSPPRCIQPVCLPISVFLPLTFPQRPWPVDGGEANPPAAVPPSLILTGPTLLLGYKQEELTIGASCHKNLAMSLHTEVMTNSNTSNEAHQATRMER